MAKPSEDPKQKALDTAAIIEDALQSIANQVGRIFEDAMSTSNGVVTTVTKDIQRRFNNMAKVTDDIASNAVKLKEGLSKTKDIEDQILKRKTQQESLGVILTTHMKQQGIAVSNINELTKGVLNNTLQLNDTERDLVLEYIKAEGYNNANIAHLEEQLKQTEKINKTTGLTGKILKGISKIPIVGPLLDTEKALIAANKAADDGAGKLGTMGAAAKSMGGSLLSSLSDPLVSVGLLAKGFKMFLDLGFKADTEITNLSKSMASSKEEATATRNRFIEIQNSNESLFETTKNLVKAQLDLANAFGVTRGFSEQQVRDQVLLTEQMGFQSDEAAGIQQLAMSNGMTAREVTGSVIKQTAALAKQTGIQLDNKKIISQVAKISGQLRLQYANNPALIAKAVVQTQKLGLSLEQAADASKSLLDFESSIESELSAELLTGKALNLERARGLALNGDAAGAAEEMLKQVGSAADFTNMNVIQQEAIAKAVGMSADDLANSLVTQENLVKLGGETRKQLKEKAEALRDAGKIDEANRLLASAGDEKQAQAALERISAQDKFNAAMEKLKSTVASLVEGPAASLVDKLGNLLGDASSLKAIFYSISAILGAMSLTKLISGLISALVTSGALAATTAATASAITLGVGALAVAAGIGTIMYAVSSAKSDAKKVNDGIISPTGGMVVSGPEGSIQLNKKDSIIAGTNLGGGGGGENTSSIVNAISELRRDVNALANRPIHISIDGKKFIEATIGAQPNKVGDEMRKNGYETQ